MRAIRAYLIVLCVLMGAAGSAQAWVSININLFPELVPVPGYPVYYAPRMSSNYFFYDGMYWIYEDDEWYVSSWYNGPWEYVDPVFVPVYVLRVPVRYYRRPPPYFRDWRPDAPPRWGHHWGRDWERNRSGWDHWDRARVPALAPLPVYQRHYSGDRYPREDQQRDIRSNNYRYQPRDSMVREHYQAPVKHVNEPVRDNRGEHQQWQRENNDRQMSAERESRERNVPSQHRDDRDQRYERDRAQSQQRPPSFQQQGPARQESVRPEPTRQEPARQEQMQREPAGQPREFNSYGNGSGPSSERARGHGKDRNDDRK